MFLDTKSIISPSDFCSNRNKAHLNIVIDNDGIPIDLNIQRKNDDDDKNEDQDQGHFHDAGEGPSHLHDIHKYSNYD